MLYARVGVPHCYECGREISSQTAEQIVDQILAFPEGTRIQLLAPVIRGRKGEYTKLFEEIGKRALRASGSTARSASSKTRSSSTKSASIPSKSWSTGSS